MPTKLEIYKSVYRCRHDGETVLKAAELDDFTSGGDCKQQIGVAVAIRFPVDVMLRALGIHEKMSKREIVNKLRDVKILRDDNFLRLVEREAMKFRWLTSEVVKNVHPHPRVKETYQEDALKEVVRKRIVSSIDHVISFCEDQTNK